MALTPDVEAINTEVANRINQVDGIVTDAVDETASFLEELRESMQFDIPFMEWNPYFVDLPALIVTATEPTRPDIAGEIQDALQGLREPSDPSLIAIHGITAPAVREFENKMPELDLPDIPEPSFPSAPADIETADVAIPERPSYTLPSPPVIQNLDIPTLPSDTIPAFTGTVPENRLIPPVNTFSFTEEQYLSDLLDSIKAKNLAVIEAGGAGLGEEIETAMIDRMKERDEKLLRDTVDRFTAEYSAKAFDLPTGKGIAGVRKILSDYEDKKQDQSREITIEQAKLALDNYKFAVSSGIQVETVLIAHHDAVAKRALNSAKAAVDAAVAIFNSETADYNSKLDAVRVAAIIYDSQVKASMQRLEYCRLQIEATKLSADMQIQYVELYKAELAGLEALLGLYKTDMEAANIALGNQKLKIDIFGKKIDAYSTRVNAEAAKYQAYKAKTEGEMAKATSFEAASRGYLAYVEVLFFKLTQPKLSDYSDPFTMSWPLVWGAEAPCT
ncbi:MAG: hypothetical protein M1497_16000, partial [Nitrospirae bacterium]|nr:hypothetical protein [Nitrospirota bacterium]